MVIISKILKKRKGVNDVRSKTIERQLHELPIMSRGSTLLSRGTMEAEGWLDVGRGCAIQQRNPCLTGSSLENLWDESGSRRWVTEPGSATAITSLIRDLSLGSIKMISTLNAPPTSHYTTTATTQGPTAPPSKRQCRSLSLSDEFGGFRSSWRPQSSRVWTAVEKRRCHSGGSVRGGCHFPPMQRSSSFSLPSHPSNPSELALDLPFFNQQLPPHPQFTASPVSSNCTSSLHHHSSNDQLLLRPLSLSNEQISLSQLQTEEVSESSSPDSTPELGRRAAQRAGRTGCLSRSKSQPCVLNDKKIGMKRRRPEETQEQRPSLDLAKMTQKLHTFQSLSCPGFSAIEGCQSTMAPLFLTRESQSDLDFMAVPEMGHESCQEIRKDNTNEDEDSSYEEELDSDSAFSVNSPSLSPVGSSDGKHALWKGDRGSAMDIFQLGGELDLDQIERN
ncbi:protein FAM53B-like [Gouania willdenowi]|uniref:Protein FAM53B-like n=1 Tax=Gouania willdenowi TaxID=441366 RepID=A0A8C5GP77_GOUWI|nr:protein FAM53B-like [Gouania willdenowi]XP_028325228.1 protein FAM53B-like [Gouania willdenowi]